MIENKSIIFIATGGKAWIGGLYYLKNAIYTLFKNNKISKTTKIYIIASKDNTTLFDSFLVYQNVQILVYKNSVLSRIIKKVTYKILDKTFDLELYFMSKKYNIDYIYPVSSTPYLFLEDKSVYWIPDFQHIHLPNMFSEDEIKWRNKTYSYIAENHKNLILSSKNAFNDYRHLFPRYTQNVHVFNFESYIADDIKGIDIKFMEDTINKYELPKKFLFLPNQFWKHKNHITAFKAIEFLVNEKEKDICLVCTGNTLDYRDRDYFNYLLGYIKENKLESNIKILGFISRQEQLALMKASEVVIQPSLFEGWSTVVEDAKALNKDIILSNIDVHYEQRNDKCIFFDRENYKELGEIINNFIIN